MIRSFVKSASWGVTLFLFSLGVFISTNAVAEDFTIVVLPDTQYYSQDHPMTFDAQTNWIVDNKDLLNIVQVIHVGDIVNTASSIPQWQNADFSMSLLEDPLATSLPEGIPYGISPGNHDQNLGNFNHFFGANRFIGEIDSGGLMTQMLPGVDRSYYGGHYPGGDNENSYTLFSASGMDFIVIYLNHDTSPDAGVLDWADQLLKDYSDRRAIVASHHLMGVGDPGTFSNQGTAIYNALKDNPNLFLMVSGHVHGEGIREDELDPPHPNHFIHTLLADYQDLPNGGNGWLRILRFSPANDEITVQTYSPSLGEYGTDAAMGEDTTSDEFTLDYDMLPKVIISGFQSWNTPGGQNPGEFVELFNTTDQPISLENMELISHVDNNADGVLDIDWELSANLTGKTIAPHSFFLIAESGVAAPNDLHDIETAMDLATGEGGVAERAIGLQLTIDGEHMDHVLYGWHDGSDTGANPDGDISFDGTSWPREEVIRNTRGTNSFQEGVIRRLTAEDLYAGQDVLGFYTDEDTLGDSNPSGVWSSPHDETYGGYEARNSQSPAVDPPTCYALMLGHAGNGSDPIASPTNSTGCAAGEYVADEDIALSGATPASGWEIDGWSGTDDDASTANTNTVTMPASAHAVDVDYVATTSPSGGVSEDFESGFTTGQTIGTHPDWYDGGGGPIVTNGIGVAGSIGLAEDNSIFTWTAHSFDWNDPNLAAVIVGMDFQANGSGQFDDDRVGWMISDSSTSSSNIFGVQLDPGGSGQNIEAYWDGDTFGDDGGRTSIVDLPTLSNNAWYRLRAKFTKLTLTSARIDVTLTELGSSGNEGAVVASGDIPDTDLLPNEPDEEIPNPGYFTPTQMWPAFKNHTGASGAADNPYFEMISNTSVMSGDVIISGFQSWNTPAGQNPGEFVELFNTTDRTISLENMELISRVDNDSDGMLEVDWQLSENLTGKTIAPNSFFLIAESGVVAPSSLHDVVTDMDLATGEGGVAERAVGMQLIIDGAHMDHVLYGRHDGSSPAGEIPLGDIPFAGFDGTTVIPAGSEWKYLDDGSDQGTAWVGTGFDDSTWTSGPAQLGYGDGDEATLVSFGPDSGNKYVTTYFRHSFDLTDASSIDGLTLGLVRDDGAVVYLNGAEVHRDNMPGTSDYSTFASSAVGGADESTFFTSSVDPDLLVDGTNVIAVEIHQSSPSSSDLSFDLELSASSERSEVIRNTKGTDSFQEGLVRRESANDLYASYDVPGFYSDEDSLGGGYTNGVWRSPHDNTDGSYAARNSLSPAVLPPAPEPGWTSYIDLRAEAGDGNHPNVLQIVPGLPETQPIDPATYWVLKDFSDGTDLPVTMSVDMEVQYPTTNGADSAPGTDADQIFGGIVDGVGGYEIVLDGSDDYVTLTFENLAPTKEYVVAVTYNRNNPPYTDRATMFTISDADTYVNASSTGVVVNGQDSVSFSTGNNGDAGYVAKWTGVAAADGSFSVTAVQDDSAAEGWDTGSKGYAMTSVLLQEGDGGALPTCFALTVGHTGQGSDPLALPTNSTGCSAGEYIAGESIDLSGAAPDADWQIGSWTGTDNDSSTSATNTATMPVSAHTVEVNYEALPPPSGGVTEDFESGFTIEQTVGTHPDWYDYGSGPEVTDGIGVAGSIGLAPGSQIFTWTAHSFSWVDDLAINDTVVIGMDFESPSGVMDDDRVGWMTTNDSVDSDLIFGVQIDPVSSNVQLMGYWDHIINVDEDERPAIAEIAAPLGSDVWYRLEMRATKLSDTSARIDASLTELNTSGNPVGAPVLTGSIADTSTLGDESPDVNYFAGTLYPAFKNHTSASGAADNPYFEIISSTPAVRFAAIGDYGDGSSAEGSVASLVNSKSPDFIVTVGDNSYGSNDIDVNIGQFYSDYIGDYTGSYGSGSAENRFFPSLGNHDYTDGGGINAHYGYFTLPGNERYYDFVQGPVHFFVIDSNPAGIGNPGAAGDGRSETSVQAGWLQTQLAASTAPWKIVYMHHPPYSSSSNHGSESEMQWPYEAWGATAVFAGHDHVYERIVRADGNGDGNDFAYFTTGAGGRSLYNFGASLEGSKVRCGSGPSSGDEVINPVLSGNCYGAMIIDASSTSITFEYWSIQDGGTLVDTYTIGDPTGPASETATFQEGVNGYTGTQDTFLQEDAPNEINGSDDWFEWDSDDPDGAELEQNLSLIRFDNIVSAIPSGSQIVSATLTYTVFNLGQDGDVREMLDDWDEDAVSLTSLCGAECLEDTHYGAASIATAIADPIGTYSVDVTSSVQAWVNGDSFNRGWIMLPPDTFESGGGVQVRSSEYGTESERPKLTVRYNPAPATERPADPSDLAATAVSASEVDVTWTDNANNANQESSFEIEWSPDVALVPFINIATVPADSTSYIHSGLAPESQNCYRVRAVNSIGPSDYTTELACATTPAGPATLVLQEGVNGYAGTVDTHIMEDEPTVGHGTLGSVEWDSDDPQGTGQYKHALIRFDDIFGPDLGQIPEGLYILSATLEYTVYNEGDPADANEVSVPWSEGATYNDFGGDPGVQGDEYGASSGTAFGDSTGTYSIDVTASLAAWASNPADNMGWIFQPTGANGVDFRSSEYAAVSERPKLTIVYSTEPILYLENFDGYGTDENPTGWFDTGANNSLVENGSLFKTVDVDGEMAFGTSSTLSNIHSHYTAATYDAGSGGILYSGRMRMSASGSGIGVTINSDYPNSDTYYRLRRYGSSGSNAAFHLSPHGRTVSGLTNTAVTPEVDTWYRFVIEVVATETGTQIRAKVWDEDDPEPTGWQIDATDSGAGYLTGGKIGVWSYGPGDKRWDDLQVEALGPVNQEPMADCNVIPVEGVAPLSVDYDGSGSTDDGTVDAYEWLFDDGSASSAAMIGTHTFNAAGEYSVQLTVTDNEGATGSCQVTVNVSEPDQPPFITGHPGDLTVDEGASATFTVLATGTPTLEYQWERSDDNGASWNPIVGAADASYTLVAAQLSDSDARFRCLVSNGVTQNVPSNPAMLTVQEVLYEYFEDFDGYGTDEDPTGWFDTGANNSLAENGSLFKTVDVDGEKAFGTSSTLSNIHSHYTAATYDAGSGGILYSGRMRMSASGSGIGVTINSDYPNSDTYYRLRRYGSSGSNAAFHLSPHGRTVSGATNTGVTPVADTWYRFVIEVVATETGTQIRAKVWDEDDPEPPVWQIDATDSGAGYLTGGKIGVWGYSSGNKYWDELTVELPTP